MGVLTGWRPDYVSLEQLSDFVRIADTVDDLQMAAAITAASRAVDRFTGRQFGKVTAAEARYYTARWDRARLRWLIEVDDLMDDTGLSVSFDSADDGSYPDTITDYVLAPRNAAQSGLPWTELRVRWTAPDRPLWQIEGGVKVTALWGWTEVPTAVVEATLLQASRLLARRDAPFGVAGSPEHGSEMRLLAKVDPDVEVVLRDYKRKWLGV